MRTAAVKAFRALFGNAINDTELVDRVDEHAEPQAVESLAVHIEILSQQAIEAPLEVTRRRRGEHGLLGKLQDTEVLSERGMEAIPYSRRIMAYSSTSRLSWSSDRLPD